VAFNDLLGDEEAKAGAYLSSLLDLLMQVQKRL